METQNGTTKPKGTIWVIIAVVVVILIIVVVGGMWLFKQQSTTPTTAPITNSVQPVQSVPSGTIIPQTVPAAAPSPADTTGVLTRAEIENMYQGLTKDQLQGAYDECIKHPDMNAGKFDCSVILDMIKSK